MCFCPRRPARGLSPRVRGNLLQATRADQRLRSIPACAGEPRPAVLERYPEPVYPRVCGGTRSARLGWSGWAGLSPRVRGNPPISSPSS